MYLAEEWQSISASLSLRYIHGIEDPPDLPPCLNREADAGERVIRSQ